MSGSCDVRHFPVIWHYLVTWNWNLLKKNHMYYSQMLIRNITYVIFFYKSVCQVPLVSSNDLTLFWGYFVSSTLLLMSIEYAT